MRIIPTADWHLCDRLGRTADPKARAERVAADCERHRADVLAVAGDLFYERAGAVEVADALRIGWFATAGAQARRPEGDIIGEGFGSLDRDGLRCTTDEVHRPKDRLALKRVVLVSHPEEFVGRFPVGWRPARGATGTTAERFRR